MSKQEKTLLNTQCIKHKQTLVRLSRTLCIGGSCLLKSSLFTLTITVKL